MSQNQNNFVPAPVTEVEKSSEEENLDVDFLPLIFNIIKSVERESTESAQNKRTDYADTSQKVLELQKKFEITRELIKKLPGIELNKDDQLLKLEALKKQLVLKKKLLKKYKDMSALEGVKYLSAN